MLKIFLLVICYALIGSIWCLDVATSAKYVKIRPGACVPIQVNLCKDIGYNLTYLPNYLSHSSQEEASTELQHFQTLIEIGCSPDLRLLLCSFYTPICMPKWKFTMPPCKSLCVKARDSCISFLEDYDYKWPEKLRCDDLPEDNPCLRKNQTSTSSSASSNVKPGQSIANRLSSDLASLKLSSPNSLINSPKSPLNQKCPCRPPMVLTSNSAQCQLSCRSPFFTIPSSWLAIWSAFCLVSTSITILTYLINPSRFNYPIRPLIFLAICYFCVAIGYLVRVMVGHEPIACSTGADSIRYGSSGAVSCSVVFLLIYFFSSAAAIWWVIMSATWFLAAGLKWSSEAITLYADVYHFLAWFIPGLQSILILTLSSVDGDPISGICFVGNTNKSNLLIFIIIPHIIFLVIGSGFLLAGFTALLKIRRTIKETGQSKTDKLEKLMLRIGIFSIVYSVPAICVILVCIYEYIYRDSWYKNYNCQSTHNSLSSQPEYAIFLVKYFMQLIIGTISGFWIWTRKTLDSWKSTTLRIFCCKHQLQISQTNPPMIPNSMFPSRDTLMVVPLQQKQHLLKSSGSNISSKIAAPETLSSKALLAAANNNNNNNNSSYNINGRSVRSSIMLRSGYSSNNATSTDMISLTHV